MLRKFIAALALTAAVLAGSSASAQVKDLRWATSTVGSSGHKALVALADVLNKEMPSYRIAVLPTPGAIVTIKGFATGEYDGFYGSDVAFHEFATDSGRFKGFKSQVKHQPVQSFWAFTLETGIGIRASDRDKIKSWADLAGKRVFTGPLPFDIRAHLERALAALDIKFQYVQVDLSTAGSQLASGAIDAICIYTSAETTPTPWLAEASLAVDWAALNPSAAEIAKLKTRNFDVIPVQPAAFKRNVHVDKVMLSPFFYGFDVGMAVPEADVHRMLTIIEKNAAALSKTDESFAQIAKDMPGMQVRGVRSSLDLAPIHPGLARYMREKGVWDAKWDSKIATK